MMDYNQTYSASVHPGGGVYCPVGCRRTHLIYCTLHACVGDHTEDAGLESPVKWGQRLVCVNRSGTRHNTLIRASSLQVESDFQHLWMIKTEIPEVNRLDTGHICKHHGIFECQKLGVRFTLTQTLLGAKSKHIFEEIYSKCVIMTNIWDYKVEIKITNSIRSDLVLE